MGVIDKAVEWALKIANDNSHGYDQSGRWGPDYDCSSFIITAYEKAGTGVKSKGATYTGNMFEVFTKCGFENVIKQIDLGSGKGLKKGDILLNTIHHTALVIEDGGKMVHASINENGEVTGGIIGDQTGQEIYTRGYYNKPWNVILRYTGPDAGGNERTPTSTFTANWVERELPNLTTSQMAAKVYERYQMLKSKETINYKLCNSPEAKTNEYGFRIYKNKFYMIALGTYYGNAGTWVKIQFADGTEIVAIMGDEKADHHTDSRHMYHIQNGINFLEVIVDANVIKSQEHFLEQCDKTGIPSKSAVTKIWTSDTEPSYSETTEFGNTGQAETKSYNFTKSDTRVPLHPTIFKQGAMIGLDGNPQMEINNIRVTRYMGDLSWQNTIDELATTMNFSLAKTDARYISNLMYMPSIGDIVRYGTDNEKFRGIIIDIDDGDINSNKYTAVDAGWYMNKSSDTYQFTEQRADECIKFILDRKSVPIVEMTTLTAKISQIYIDKNLSDTIRDILDKCDGTYNFDFVPNGIRIYSYGAHTANSIYSPAPNIAPADSFAFRGVENHVVSMEDLITSVKLINDTDVFTVTQNAGTIEKYGFIQRIERKSDGDDPVELPKSILKQNSVFKDTYSFEIIEQLSDYTRAGESVLINEIKYIIESTNHSIKKGIHHVDVSLKRAETLPMSEDKISTVVVSTESENKNNADIENTVTSSGTGGKIIVIDPGHGKDSGSMSSDEKINAGYVYNAANGQWGEWRHFKSGTWGEECGSSGCTSTGPSCWYSMGNGDRETEPDLNLKNALAAKKHLEEMGYTVRMTRTSNLENPSFTKRAAYAFANNNSKNQPDAACIVCLHSNAGGGRGSAYIQLSGSYNQKYIPSDYIAKSNSIGKKINDRIVSQTDLSAFGGGVLEGEPHLILFNKSPVPVAYMEIGFFDSSDLSILNSQSDKIGQAIADGVNDFLGGA